MKDSDQRVLQGSRITQHRQHAEARGLAEPAKRLFNEVTAVLFPQEAVVARGEEFTAVGNLDEEEAVLPKQGF